MNLFVTKKKTICHLKLADTHFSRQHTCMSYHFLSKIYVHFLNAIHVSCGTILCIAGDLNCRIGMHHQLCQAIASSR